MYNSFLARRAFLCLKSYTWKTNWNKQKYFTSIFYEITGYMTPETSHSARYAKNTCKMKTNPMNFGKSVNPGFHACTCLQRLIPRLEDFQNYFLQFVYILSHKVTRNPRSWKRVSSSQTHIVPKRRLMQKSKMSLWCCIMWKLKNYVPYDTKKFQNENFEGFDFKNVDFISPNKLFHFFFKMIKFNSNVFSKYYFFPINYFKFRYTMRVRHKIMLKL